MPHRGHGDASGYAIGRGGIDERRVDGRRDDLGGQVMDVGRVESLGLDGTEVVSITGIEQLNEGVTPKTVRVVAEPSEHSPAGKQTVEFDAVVRIDTPGEADYYRNGGILQYVLRSLL